MKSTERPWIFLATIVFWVVCLQGMMLTALFFTENSICNGSGAWPLSQYGWLGHGLTTLFFTAVVALWAWKDIHEKGKETELLRRGAWTLIVAAGLSHALERLSSQCVLDYWHIHIFDLPLYFNLGDISLTIGALFLIGTFLQAKKRSYL